MESICVCFVSFHIGWAAVIFVHIGEAGLLEPKRGCIEYRRPGLLVMGPRRVDCVCRVESPTLSWQLAGIL